MSLQQTLPPVADSDQCSCKIAESRDERRAAFELVYESYLETGLSKPNSFGMRVTPYHLLPTTEVFVACTEGETVATVSLIIDGELGLPLQSMYGDEVARRRSSGLRLSEISCLAKRSDGSKQFLAQFCELTRLMTQYSRMRHVDQMLLVSHPRHARFYQRYFGFELVGGLTVCNHVCGNPAVALCLDFQRVEEEPPAWYDRYFDELIPSEELQPRPMSALDVAYFSRFVDPCFRKNTSAPIGASSSSSGADLALAAT
jgi:hypothetical protein